MCICTELRSVSHLQVNDSVVSADVDAVRLTVGQVALIQADHERLLQAAQVVADLQRT